MNAFPSIASFDVNEVVQNGVSSAVAKNKLMMNNLQDHSTISPKVTRHEDLMHLQESAKDIDTKRDPALMSSINQSSKGKIGPFDTLKDSDH